MMLKVLGDMLSKFYLHIGSRLQLYYVLFADTGAFAYLTHSSHGGSEATSQAPPTDQVFGAESVPPRACLKFQQHLGPGSLEKHGALVLIEFKVLPQHADQEVHQENGDAKSCKVEESMGPNLRSNI